MADGGDADHRYGAMWKVAIVEGDCGGMCVGLVSVTGAVEVRGPCACSRFLHAYVGYGPGLEKTGLNPTAWERCRRNLPAKLSQMAARDS